MKFRSIALVLIGLAAPGMTFKIASHVSTANQVLDDIAAQVQQGGGDYTLRFRGLDLKISVKDGYDAILANPDFFRAGSLGPDAFPDMITGQMDEHSNRGLAAKGNDHRTTDVTYDLRENSKQYRSIDYGMRLLVQARNSGSSQNIAFALGYLGHVSGDGFMHAWVNEQAKGAWSYTDGQGLFGPLSEEIKHVASEGLVDQSMPDKLLTTHPRVDDKIDYSRVKTAAPYDLLDHLYSEELPRSGGEPVGGDIYKYFSFQKTAMNDIEAGTNASLNVLASVAGGPGSPSAVSWVMGRIPGMDALRYITGYNPAEKIAQMFFDDNPLFNPATWYLDQVKDNMHNLNASVDVYRRNWVVMSHCTADNLLKSPGVGNPDRCLELGVEPNLAYPGMSGANKTLLQREMTENFALAQDKDYHKLGDNVGRAAKYLLNGFRLKELPSTLVPADLRLGWVNFKDWLRNNNSVIVDIALYPVATAAAELVCLGDGGVCATDCITNDCSMKILRCVPDKESWCDDNFCHTTLGVDWCDPGYLVCVAGAATWCAGSGVVGCVGCNTGCVWDLAGCTAGNLFDFNSSRKLADAIDDILSPLDAIKAYAVDYLQRRACDVGTAIGLPIADVHRVVGIYKTIDMLEKQGKYGFVNFAFLEEDLKDPAWMAKLSKGNTQLQAVLVKIRDGQYRFIGDELSSLPVDVPANCFTFNTTGAFYKDANFGVILTAQALFAEPGPSAKSFLEAMGPDIPNTFPSFYNTVQLMKLLPMKNASDMNRLFQSQGADARFLPWNDEGKAKYSKICQEDLNNINIICDAIPSLDDPDAYSRKSEELNARDYLLADKTAGPTWIWGRSVTPGNKYTPENSGWTPYVNTPFPLATTDDAIEKLYKKIFLMPSAVPEWMGLDSQKDLWTVAAPAKVSLDATVYKQGTSSMAVTGCGYMSLVSPRAKTSDFGAYSNKLSMDIYVPAPQTNPYWQGALQMSVDLSAAGIYNLYVGQAELTNLPTGTWSKVTFTLPPALMTAMDQDLPGLQFKLALNVTCGNAPFRIDNLRFENPLTVRKTFHSEGSRGQTVLSGSLMGFEVASDWNHGSAQTGAYTTHVMQGQQALKVVSGGWNTVVSRNFSTSELPAVSSSTSFDLFVPDPQPNQWWVGSVALSFNCPSAGLYNVQIGQSDLSKMFWGEYNQVKFDLPEAVKTALLGNHTDASWSFALNTNVSGDFALDNFGFIGTLVPRGPVDPIIVPPAGFVCSGPCLSARPLNWHASLDGTAETWFVTGEDIHGWTASEMQGRTISVNGVDVASGVMPLPNKVNGKYYFRVSAGGNSWASITFW